VDHCELSVVIPAYREADALKQLLPILIPAVNALSRRSEIIVVDSIEPLDCTAAICKEFGVRHMHRARGNAYGDAVRTGIDKSVGEIVVLMDADGSHNPKDVERLWSARNQAEIVIGSRYIEGGRTENPVVLIWMSRLLNYFYRFAFDLPASDISNSFRLYRGAQLRSLELESNNFEIVEEILIKLTCGPMRAAVTEVPVTFEKRKAGMSKRNLPAFILSYMSSILTMRKFQSAELMKRRA
jgi:dolichol-phosphate mannosyltransferase